jgi:uncharacterized protein (TIGR02453 family)
MRDTAPGSFEGFQPEVARFFAGLRRHNDKAWFDQHRDEWTALVKQPMEALLAEAEPQYGTGRIMRINRDVRFSADKSPYQTSSSLWAGTPGAIYLHLSDSGIRAGGGLYDPSRDQLARARTTIDERPAAAATLQDALDELTDAGFQIAGPSLATAPRGFPRDHPRIELLRLRHYSATRPLPLTASLDQIQGAWRQVKRLNGWIERWIGPAQHWP